LSGSITAVDDLNYSYDGNRLSNVTDGTGGSYGLFGFKNVTGSGAAYGYDASGNMAIDAKKGISLDYNILNRTDKVTVNTASGRYITYTYQAGGNLIRKQAFDNNSLVKTTDYIGGSVYENNVLSYFGMAEGRVRNTGGTLKLEYMIRDQQGNVRVSFEEQGGLAVVRQENSYYPFGLTMPGSVTPTAANKNLYNGGSEWQNDFGDLPDLQQTFYRMYDAALGRFVAADPMAEASESMTVYQYALNSPLIFNDPLGDKAAGYFPNSHRIGPGSGNHWSDGMMFSDWDGWGGGSDTYRNLLADGYSDWGGSLVKYIDGIRRDLSSQNGQTGYFVKTPLESTGYSMYFNALTGQMEQSMNVGGSMLTWNEIGTNAVARNNSNWAKATLGFIAADVAVPEPTDAAWPKWAGYAVAGAAAGTYLYMHSDVSLYNKMTREIQRIKQKTTGPQGITYALVAKSSGTYPNVRGGTSFLNAGDIWKFGQTTSANRYSGSSLSGAGLQQINLFSGNQMEIRVQEKIMIYAYFMEQGTLPPGNSIFR
jgi:RHS repeat-associated protein